MRPAAVRRLWALLLLAAAAAASAQMPDPMVGRWEVRPGAVLRTDLSEAPLVMPPFLADMSRETIELDANGFAFRDDADAGSASAT